MQVIVPLGQGHEKADGSILALVGVRSHCRTLKLESYQGIQLDLSLWPGKMSSAAGSLSYGWRMITSGHKTPFIELQSWGSTEKKTNAGGVSHKMRLTSSWLGGPVRESEWYMLPSAEKD